MQNTRNIKDIMVNKKTMANEDHSIVDTTENFSFLGNKQKHANQLKLIELTSVSGCFYEYDSVERGFAFDIVCESTQQHNREYL